MQNNLTKENLMSHKEYKFDNNKKIDGVKRKKLDISLSKKNGWTSKMNFNKALDKTIKDFKRNL